MLFPLTLAALPWALLAVCSAFSTGRDLTALFLLCSGLLFVNAVDLLIVGGRRRRDNARFAGLALLTSVLVCFFATCGWMAWTGSTTKTVEVIVQDSETGEPVADARVRILRPHDDQKAQEGRTDKRGRLELEPTFRSVGNTSALCRTGSFSVTGHVLEVEAEDYRTLEKQLERLTKPVFDLYGPPIPSIVVRLERHR
jgi:hypothetical protein